MKESNISADARKRISSANKGKRKIKSVLIGKYTTIFFLVFCFMSPLAYQLFSTPELVYGGKEHPLDDASPYDETEDVSLKDLQDFYPHLTPNVAALDGPNLTLAEIGAGSTSAWNAGRWVRALSWYSKSGSYPSYYLGLPTIYITPEEIELIEGQSPLPPGHRVVETSNFGARDTIGSSGVDNLANHRGVDLVSDYTVHDEIRAIGKYGAKVILAQGTTGGYGYRVETVLFTEDGRFSQIGISYNHLQYINCSVGDILASGDLVGMMGGSGGNPIDLNYYPVHLHLEFCKFDMNMDSSRTYINYDQFTSSYTVFEPRTFQQYGEGHDADLYNAWPYSYYSSITQSYGHGPDMPLKYKDIFIDVGHGGADDGAVSNGVKEDEVLLAVANRLRTLLINHKCLPQ